MKKLLVSMLVLTLCVIMSTCALAADRTYIFPESDTRLLTREEVEAWNYESLGYAFNEIFARHGYNFNPGQEYDNYFSTQPWYTPNDDPRNDTAVYPFVSEVEWTNYYLIRDVRAYKKHNDWGLSIWDNFSLGFDTLQGFDYVELAPNQVLHVYSAPSYSAWRGANGKAEVSTNGRVYAAGWESGWLLVMYETNNGSVRVGYVDSAKIRGTVPVSPQLLYAYEPAEVTAACILTDDPARTGTAITTLRPGTQVTYLTRYFNNKAWDYVETEVNGQLVRGFILAGSLDVDAGAEPLDTLEYDHPYAP